MPPWSLPEYLAKGRISSLPESAYYIPNFITSEEEETLLAKVFQLQTKQCAEINADQRLPSSCLASIEP